MFWLLCSDGLYGRSGRPGALQRQGPAEGKISSAASALVAAANEAGGPDTSQCCWHGSCPRRLRKPHGHGSSNTS